MKISIESTNEITTFNRIPVRVWNGVTDKGTNCLVYVHAIAFPSDADQVECSELLEQPPPIEVIAAKLSARARA